MEAVKLRPAQKKILEYPGGRMGIMAVPGSGKTWTLSYLAAEIIQRRSLVAGQEVLVVTLVNSAVDNFYRRVNEFLRQRGLMPLNFRVRTLHGLANDIVRERPELVGLADQFEIVDEREADRIRQEAAQAWLAGNLETLEAYLEPGMEDNRRDWVNRNQLPELANTIALSFIGYAKDLRLTPERLRQRLDELPLPLPLAKMGCEIYSAYQRALTYRGAVDFDDLIRLALQALELDNDLLERLRLRWPYILEDETQDSSRLQEKILALLAGADGNWVRVGDPNQAIYETFTTANPEFLRQFVAAPGVLSRTLPNSGRSTHSIIWLANRLVRWTQKEHPVESVRDALQAPPEIKPTPKGDPQPNPPDDPAEVHLVLTKYTPQQELEAVAESVARWLPEHSDDTLAVLAPRNIRGFEVADELRRRGVEVVDSLLRSSSATRHSAGALGNLLAYLSDPGSSQKLARLYKVWRQWKDPEPAAHRAQTERVAELLRKNNYVENYLWPKAGQDWLETLPDGESHDELAAQLEEFRGQVRRWQEAVLLPIDQLLLTAGQDLFVEPNQLATTHKIAVVLRQVNNAHPNWRLPELTGELAVIARNERRFLGFNDADSGFDPDQYRGKALVATMHKAKGLEWDRVYLMSANNYDFPSGVEGDQYMPEKWFLRDHLNLEAEALAQLGASLSPDEYTWYQEGQATRQARLDYVRERLRLLYVGITRARKELVITWNTGRQGGLHEALPLAALAEEWEAHSNAITA
jgi:DNA helicase-2/ATP-dependent DNA helicase PcrA